MMLQLWLSLCVNKHRVGKGIDGACMTLPTCRPRFCDPASLFVRATWSHPAFSVHRPIRHTFLFLFLRFLASLLLPKWSSDLRLVRTTGASRQPLPWASRKVDPGQSNAWQLHDSFLLPKTWLKSISFSLVLKTRNKIKIDVENKFRRPNVEHQIKTNS